jgi:tetratricopeptide (TPR) repeat protein
MKNLKYCWKSVSTAIVAILLTSFCDLMPLASAMQSPASPGKAILQRAVTHSEWFNWADATAEFEDAEKLLTSEHDERNAIYAKIGVLRATMEDHSLVDVGKQLGRIAEMPEVQSDPELLLFASITKADVDGELNALDARNEWIEIERLAKLQGNALWTNRALGERSLSEFLLGNISKGRILIATALKTAKKTNDFGGQIRYLTAIGGALHYTHQNEQALDSLKSAADLVRTHPLAGYSFVTNQYTMDALVGLNRLDEAETLSQSIIKEAAQRKRKVKQADALMTLATIQEHTNRQTQALATLTTAERLTSTGNFTHMAADVQFRFADIYRKRGENQLAEARLSRGLAITQNTPEIWPMPSRLESLAELKVADGKYLEADKPKAV